jgi:hypothetical protein
LTGTVQFFDAGVPLGNPVGISDGRVTLTTQLASYGPHSVSAAYSGDALRNQSLSDGATIAVEDFALSAGSLAVLKGHTGSTPIAVTTSPGFASAMKFTCKLPGTLTGASCSLSPASLGAAGTVTLLLNTTAAHPRAANRTVAAVTAWLGGLCVRADQTLAGIVLLLVPLRRRPRAIVAALVVCAFALALGCGRAELSDPGTPSGTYSVSVTGVCGGAASPIVHVVSVTVRVL